MRPRLSLLLLVLGLTLFSAQYARAAGDVNTCNEASLDAALNGGGVVLFHCSGTITLTSVKTISSDTTLDANGFRITLDGQNQSQHFYVNSGVTLTLQAIILVNGQVQGADGINGVPGGDVFGGSIFSSGTLILRYCTFLNNLALGGKGTDAAHLQAASPGGNAAGAAVYINGGNLTVINSTFSGNYAQGGNGGAGFNPGGGELSFPEHGGNAGGGAIFSTSGSSVQISGSTFSSNFANGGQGGKGDPTGSDNAERGAHGGDGSGAAIYTAGQTTVVNSTFYANASQGGAGGQGGVAYTYATFGSGGDGGDALGGAIFDANTLTTTNVTFQKDAVTGGLGGAIGSGPGTGSFGGGLPGNPGIAQGAHIAVMNLPSPGNTSLANTLFGDTNNANPACGPAPALFSDLGGNIAEDASCGTPNTSGATILLGPLASNGGVTQTVALLPPNNPAVGIGIAENCPALDQRSFIRATNCDSGAYELAGNFYDYNLTGHAQTIGFWPARSFHGIVASFTSIDPNPYIGNYSAFIFWGDGSGPIPATITMNNHGGYDVISSHTFLTRGPWPILVQINYQGNDAEQVHSIGRFWPRPGSY